MEKCLAVLNTEQFRKLNREPTKTTERKIQRILRKIASNLSTQEYSHLYPTGSCLGKFYAKAKIHGITSNDIVDQLPIRFIVLNTGTATYCLAK